MEESTVRVVRPDPIERDEPERKVLARSEPVEVELQGSADDQHKKIVARVLTSTRRSLELLKDGLSWYWILDRDDADVSAKIADDIDNLIRRIKQHERK